MKVVTKSLILALAVIALTGMVTTSHACWYPQGCTPGYWKNHLDAWVPTLYDPDDLISSVFTVPNRGGATWPAKIRDKTLLEALQFGGGSGLKGATKILLRAAVAAVLNKAHPDACYPWFGPCDFDPANLIAWINEGLAGDRSTMIARAAILDAYNNVGCPLN